MSETPSLLRTRGGHEHAAVTPLELFFDLVFVFAVTQLSHSLLEHLSLSGALQTLMLFLAVWWSWVFTAWATNWLDPERPAVRLLLLALMLGGLLLSTAIPEAFPLAIVRLPSALALGTATTAILVIVAVWESVALRRPSRHAATPSGAM